MSSALLEEYQCLKAGCTAPVLHEDETQTRFLPVDQDSAEPPAAPELQE